MINLIPNEEKKKKVKDFYFRLTVTFFFVLGFSIVIATVAILPAYFLSLEKKSLANQKLFLLESEEEPEINSQIPILVKDLDIKLSLAEKVQKNNYFVSEQVIKEVISKKMIDDL